MGTIDRIAGRRDSKTSFLTRVNVWLKKRSSHAHLHFFSFPLSFFLSFVRSFFLSILLSLCLYVAQGVGGLTFTSARGLVSSTYRWARLATHRHQGTQHSVCSPCSRAHFGRVLHRMCVIAERLDCLHWLAHAARHRHFSSASTSRRTASVVS